MWCAINRYSLLQPLMTVGIRMLLPALVSCALLIIFTACGQQPEHTAPAVNPRDSMPMMTSYGINTMISDSGVMKYRIIAERWDVNEAKEPPRWYFPRGLFLEQFDEHFHAQAFIQCDTAFYFNTRKLWHLIGNVRVRTVDGLRFNSEELYWDQGRHELYSNLFSRVVTPERELQGAYFTSDEKMRHYKVTNTKGSFTRDDATGKKEDKTDKDKNEEGTDTMPKRAPAQPKQK